MNLGAAVAALYFAVHPLRVESVAWITERRDLTSGLFFLLTILAYLKAHERPPAVSAAWRLVSLGAAALALGPRAARGALLRALATATDHRISERSARQAVNGSDYRSLTDALERDGLVHRSGRHLVLGPRRRGA